MQAEEIFLAAVEKKTPAERAAYLEGACGPNAELRAQVEGLIKSHAEAGSFLEQPLFHAKPTTDDPITERPGTVIGPYKLLEPAKAASASSSWPSRRSRSAARWR